MCGHSDPGGQGRGQVETAPPPTGAAETQAHLSVLHRSPRSTTGNQTQALGLGRPFRDCDRRPGSQSSHLPGSSGEMSRPVQSWSPLPRLCSRAPPSPQPQSPQPRNGSVTTLDRGAMLSPTRSRILECQGWTGLRAVADSAPRTGGSGPLPAVSS